MREIARVAACAAVASLAFGVAGCGKGSASDHQSGSASGSGDCGQLTVWIPSNAQPTEREAYLSVLNRIDEQHPEFTLKIDEQPDLSKQLLAAAVSNDLPDITSSDSNRLGVFVNAGVFVPLDDIVPQEVIDDTLPSIRDATVWDADGKLYNVAQWDAGLSLWANKAMLEEVGARIPTSYTEAWDRAEFEEILKSLKDKGYWAIDFGQADQTGSKFYYTYLPVVKSFGGDWMDRDTMKAEGALNSAGTVEAFEYMNWLAEQGYVDVAADNDTGLFEGTTAMLLYGNWVEPQARETLGDDAILVPIPDFGHGVFTGSGSQTWGITTKAEERGCMAEAGMVINDLLEPDSIKEMTLSNGSIPSRLSVLEQDERYQEGGPLYLYREQLEGGIAVNRPQTPAAVFAREKIGETLIQVMAHGDAQGSLDQATAEIDQLIEDNNYAN